MHPTTYNAKAYSAASETSPLGSTKIHGATQPITTCRSRSCSAASATPICTQVRNEWSELMPTVYPIVPGPRDRRPGDQSRLGSHQVQARRPCRGRLHGRLRPHLPALQGRPRAVLPNRRSHTTARTSTGRLYLWRLLRQHRRR